MVFRAVATEAGLFHPRLIYFCVVCPLAVLINLKTRPAYHLRQSTGRKKGQKGKIIKNRVTRYFFPLDLMFLDRLPGSRDKAQSDCSFMNYQLTQSKYAVN